MCGVECAGIGSFRPNLEVLHIYVRIWGFSYLEMVVEVGIGDVVGDLMGEG